MKFLNKELPQWAIDKYGEERLTKEIHAFDGTALTGKIERMLDKQVKTADLGSALLHALGIQDEPKELTKLWHDDSLPDIDTDFSDDKRHLVFEYMREKLGNVASIGTISTYKPRSALAQVCKKLGIPKQATGEVKSVMIERSSADSRASNCLLDTLNETEAGKKLKKMYPQVLLAAPLEGHASHTGTHAAGLLIANEPMTIYGTMNAEGIMQLDKLSAERLGLLKIDILGLRTLGILEDSGVPVDWYNLEFDDSETYRVFNEGRLCGIFQFEGNALRSISKQITFSSLSDIDAVTALARPGPFSGGVTEEYLNRRNGKPYSAIHPRVEKHMQDTYGLPMYQEQTLVIVREIGNFSWADSAKIRKLISRRMGEEYFNNWWLQFREGAISNGMDEASAKTIWDSINSMGAWQFNKAHSRSYAVLSYWTAYLKAHHPLEFAAANLRNAKDEETALRLLREIHKEGISYVPFDPMLSEKTWAVKDGKLIAGYEALKGFGSVKADKYITARKEGNLSPKMIEEALAAESVFGNIFPISTKYKDFYEDPEANGIIGKLLKTEEFDRTQEGSCVFLGKLVRKNLRDVNEDLNVKKRGGRKLSGPQIFLDITIQDDTDTIMARIDRYKYKEMGLRLNDEVPIGAVLLVRANFKKGIRFGFIQRWKLIDGQ